MSANEHPAPEPEEVLHVHLPTREAVYRAYMPFVRKGGLFVRTDKKFNLHDPVLMLVRLLEDAEKFAVSGQVIWITPARAQAGRETGVGVQLEDEKSQDFIRKVEAIVAGMSPNEPTDTI